MSSVALSPISNIIFGTPLHSTSEYLMLHQMYHVVLCGNFVVCGVQEITTTRINSAVSVTMAGIINTYPVGVITITTFTIRMENSNYSLLSHCLLLCTNVGNIIDYCSD